MAGWAALIGAAGSYLSAQQANRPRTTTTDQSSVQLPFLWGEQGGIANDINAILQRQRELAGLNGIQQSQAPAGWGGSVQPNTGGYRPEPGTGPGSPMSPGPAAGDGPPVSNQGNPPWTDTGGGPGDRPPTDPKPIINPRTGKAYGTAAASMAGNRAGGAAPAGGMTGETGGGLQAPSGPNVSNPQAIFQQAAAAGFSQANSPMFGQGNAAISNILGASATAGGQGGGQTGFEGYNPILAQVAQQLMGSTRDPRGQAMLEEFLAGQQGGGGGQPGPTYAYTGGGGDPRDRPAGGGLGFSGGASSQGGGIADTMATPGFFTSQVQNAFNQGPNPEMEALINASAADQQRLRFQQMADIDAASQGAGRLGGSTWSGLRQSAEDESSRNLANMITGTRYQDFNDRRNYQGQLLGQVNARDIAAMNDRTNRAGIDAQANAASASASAAAQSAAQAQRLQAIGMLMGNENQNLGLLSDVGNRLSSDRLGATGLIGDLSNAQLAGINAATNAGAQWDQGNVAREGIRAQQQQANAALSFQRQQYNQALPQQQLNDYLRTIAAIGGMGGVSATSGTNVQPGAGVNPYGAAVLGGVGAGTAAYGATGRYW